MKIGIITYHWAINYGAVIQAYALQTYLQRLGHEVEFINYVPEMHRNGGISKYIGRNFLGTKLKWKTIARELSFKPFMEKLNVGKLYKSFEVLKSDAPRFDIYICGSDQVWNNSLVSNKANSIHYPYYLNFGDETVKRIAYAPSFGASCIEESIKNEIIECLGNFDAISVREKSGVDLVKTLGFSKVEWMPDPTFLLKAEDYLNFSNNKIKPKEDFVYSYVLEGQVDNVLKVLDIVSDNGLKPIYNIFMGTVISALNSFNITPSPEKWLQYLNSSSFVITNSFHSTVFAIIFKKPFLTIPLSGEAKGRNERIISLLENLGLSDRILWNYAEKEVRQKFEQEINWNDVDTILNEWRESAHEFLVSVLER